MKDKNVSDQWDSNPARQAKGMLCFLDLLSLHSAIRSDTK